MRDPLHTISLRGDLLQQALARFPNLDVGATEVVTNLEYTAEIITALLFTPLEEYAISRSRFRVILYLTLMEMMGNEPPSPSGIADNLGVTRATMTDLLDGLERDGTIERRNVGRDRRAQAIHLTDAGRALFDKLVAPLTSKVTQVVASLTPDERQTLVALLKKLAAANGALVAP